VEYTSHNTLHTIKCGTGTDVSTDKNLILKISLESDVIKANDPILCYLRIQNNGKKSKILPEHTFTFEHPL